MKDTINVTLHKLDLKILAMALQGETMTGPWDKKEREHMDCLRRSLVAWYIKLDDEEKENLNRYEYYEDLQKEKFKKIQEESERISNFVKQYR